MHRLWVGPQCDRVDVVVSGEEDVGVGVEMVAEACGLWGEGGVGEIPTTTRLDN
jgi:hypothetical protein